MQTFEDYPNEFYYDPTHPGSFNGATKLYKAVKKEQRLKLNYANIQKWLKVNTLILS